MSNCTQKLTNITHEINNQTVNTKTNHTISNPHLAWMASQACLLTFWLGFFLKKWPIQLEQKPLNERPSLRITRRQAFVRKVTARKEISTSFDIISRRWSVVASVKKGFLGSQRFGSLTVQLPTVPNAVWRVLLSFGMPGWCF